MKLSELFEQAPDIEIANLMADSRKKRPDSIFFCVKGMMFDGHKFIEGVLDTAVDSCNVCRLLCLLFISRIIKKVQEIKLQALTRFYFLRIIDVIDYVA